jgi:ABC-2 type transport system permease protein
VRFPVLARALGDRRRSLVWWSVGVAAYLAMIVAVFPTVRDASGMQDLMSQYPKSVLAMMGIADIDFTSGAGYLAAELFGFMVPLFVLVLTIGTGAAAIGGAEDRGALDLVLAHPVRRRSVLLQNAAVVAVEAVLIGAVVIAGLAIADPIVDLRLQYANLFGTVLGVVLLGIVFGWLALVLGAATGSRAVGLGATSAFAALAYLGSTLPELVDGLRPVRWFSPFFYATSGSPLALGFDWWHAAVLAATAVVVLAVGVVLFDRRALAR